MVAAALPAQEAHRLAVLSSYEVLDTPCDPHIDVFVRMAAQMYDVPISLVSLVDERRAWFKASVGGDFTEAPRELAFCAHAILDPGQVMVVEDMLLDPRFADNALVTGAPDIRFYAGAPIISAEGQPLGTICIIDRKARQLDEAGRTRLADLALGVGAALDLHRNVTRLHRAATRDPLTGLANRALFDPALDRAAQRSQSGEPCGVLLLDLDRFKEVNDRLGHAAGDAVLRGVAARLIDAVRVDDLVARLGGDEFAVLLKYPMGPGGPRALANRILASFTEPFVFEGENLSLNTSIGFAAAPFDGDSATSLMRAADRAMYLAKDIGRGVAADAADLPVPPPPQPNTLMADLRAAALSNGFTLEWQPYFETATGSISGCEALIRWQRPGYGNVLPELFIPMAESVGMMERIDLWVLSTACEDAASWSAPVDVNLNVTPSTFCAADFARRVARVLERTKLQPRRLMLEVTERMAVECPDLVRARIAELHDIGVRVALDDFGTGFSALASLKDFAFDKLKLDRAFIRDLGRDHRSDAVARAIIELGHATEMVVCAEGVETGAQLEFLMNNGCELAQGFLLARPARVARMADFDRPLAA